MELREKPGMGSRGLLVGLSVLMGVLITSGGLYLGYRTFQDARSLIHNPKPLEKWIGLRDIIQPDKPAKSKVPAKPQSDTKKNKVFLTVKDVEQFAWIGGGYLTLIISILYLSILARISLAFMSKGVEILVKSYQLIKD
ncbi:MAG: hypothetical protein OEZ36_07855 [Spirochaetota bacterium]|nr:hypothetical protein [Spirochaetota bacterium]